MVQRSTTSLAPGFRFHPTDEELISYYLKHKILGKPFRWDAISEVDIYKFEPWDLPVQSKLKTRDLEWYFFSVLDRKYGNGSRTNRTTDRGYWKTTGKDRPVKRGAKTVGMKKTLVYHCGRAPRGDRTNWVMHEYKMVEELITKPGAIPGVFVVCRIFQKSGSGPKNGEQYGAPFVEEEWDDEDMEATIVPGIDIVNEVVPAADDIFVEADDFDQALNMTVVPEDAVLPSNMHGHGGSTSSFLHDSQKMFPHGEEDDTGSNRAMIFPYGSRPMDFPQPETHQNMFLCDRTDENSGFFSPNEFPEEYSDLFLDEPYFDASDAYFFPSDGLMFSQGLFLEENDLADPINPCCGSSSSSRPTVSPFDDYLTYFDEDAFAESSALTGAPISEPEPAAREPERGEVHHSNPIVKYASGILGSIDAPPAMAAEKPAKGGAVRTTSASLAAVCTTGMLVQIHDSVGVKWHLGKDGCVNCVVSLGVPSLTSCCSGGGGGLSGKLFSVVMVAALVLCVASKVGFCCC